MEIITSFFQDTGHLFLYYIFPFVVVLGIMIFFHELGHFLVAKYFNVKVLKFALGFGPKIVAKKIGETEYSIRYIPLGGFVKMLGEDVEEEEAPKLSPQDEERAFNKQHALKRIAIVTAGPMFNLILALFLFCGMYLVSGDLIRTTEIGEVDKDSPAFMAGIKEGDIITSIEGKAVKGWDDFEEALQDKAGRRVPMTVQRQGELINVIVTPEEEPGINEFGEEIKTVQIGVSSARAGNIVEVFEDSPAQRAGLKEEDYIISVNGNAVKNLDELQEALQDKAGRPVPMTVQRRGELINLVVTPEEATSTNEFGEDIKTVQIGITITFNYKRIDLDLNPIQAIEKGCKDTWMWTKLTLLVIVKLFEGIVSVKTLGGPIMIGQLTGELVQENIGFIIPFMGIISINLGILNLFPIPILDGGLIVFLLIELIMGKPLSLKTRETAMKIGFSLLIALMILVFYNDILRLFQPTS